MAQWIRALVQAYELKYRLIFDIHMKSRYDSYPVYGGGSHLSSLGFTRQVAQMKNLQALSSFNSVILSQRDKGVSNKGGHTMFSCGFCVCVH